MKSLPIELQTEYVALLGPESLSSLCLVSRSMRRIAFPLLYRSLIMNPKFIGPLSIRIIAENESNAHSSSLRSLRITDYVRELTIIYPRVRYYPPSIGRNELRLAIRALPFLTNVCHLRWLETVMEEDSGAHPGSEYATLVQTARDTFGEKLRTLEAYFRTYNQNHTFSMESKHRIPVRSHLCPMNFNRLRHIHSAVYVPLLEAAMYWLVLLEIRHKRARRLETFTYIDKSALTRELAYLYKNIYYEPFCKNLVELAPCLEVLDFSTAFHNYFDIVGNFFSSIDESVHFPRLRELHIRSPFNDDEICEKGSTPLVTFIKRHATQIKALSLPCPIEEFDNDYLYKTLDLPSLPNLTKLDVPVLWVNLLVDRGLVPKLEELKVWLSFPGDQEYQTQEESKVELGSLLTRLRNVPTLRMLDLCHSEIGFDVELIDMLSSACPSLTWLAISILEPEINWSDVVSSLYKFESLHTLRTPEIPHLIWDVELHAIGPSEASHSAALEFAKACPTVLHLEAFNLERVSLGHGCPRVQFLWSFYRDSRNLVEVDYTLCGKPLFGMLWSPADFE